MMITTLETRPTMLRLRLTDSEWSSVMNEWMDRAQEWFLAIDRDRGFSFCGIAGFGIYKFTVDNDSLSHFLANLFTINILIKKYIYNCVI